MKALKRKKIVYEGLKLTLISLFKNIVSSIRQKFSSSPLDYDTCIDWNLNIYRHLVDLSFTIMFKRQKYTCNIIGICCYILI